MADKKQLVLVVEGNAALSPYWRTIVSDYLEKLIRAFCGNEAMEAASPVVELALVQFHAHGCCNPCLIQRSGWTRNVEYFLQWLSAMHVNGGGFGDAAIAEGLAEVLTMFPFPNVSQTHQNGDCQRHCILVAASNPYPLPTPVYRPPAKSETESESCLSDAETVARSFPQCLVSLSVICPRQLPKLESIYKVGKSSPSAADYTIDVVKNPQYLVLISEKFMKACADLRQSGMTILLSNHSSKKLRFTLVSVSGPPSTSVSPVSGSLLNWKPASVEPGTVSSTASTRNLQDVPTVSCVTSEELLSLHASSPLSTCQEVLSSNDNWKDLKPGASVLRSGRPSAVTLMPPPRMSQQAQRVLQSLLSKYVKLWEGDLSYSRLEETVFVTRLEAYREATSPESLAADWPSTMLVNRVVPQEELYNKKFVGKRELIFFLAKNQHEMLAQVQVYNFGIVIRLPSQTLLLTVPDKTSHLLGMLFPLDMVAFEPQTSKQPQLPPPSPPTPSK